MSRARADVVRAAALWGFCPLTRMLGHDPHPLLTAAGLRESDLNDSDHFLPRSSAAALLELSAARLERPDFGLLLARIQGVHVLGAVTFAVRNAPDWGGAIAVISKHIHHHSPMAAITIEPSDAAHEQRIVFRRPEETTAVQLAEHALGLFCRIGGHLTGGRHRPTRVTFAHSPASSAEAYREHFGVSPEFDAPDDAVCVDERELRLPLKAAVPQLQAIIEDYLDHNAPTPGPDVDRRVREAVEQMISNNGAARVDDVSSMLHMRARTLQRRLAQEGTTFGKVCDGVRRHMAEVYLADDGVPLARLPGLLGYTNRSALNRSCTRWFGKPPHAIRAQVTHPVERF